MSTIYADDIADVLAEIQENGGVVTFPGALSGTPQVYDPATDTYSGGTPATDATGYAIQGKNNPTMFSALSLTLVRPITLKVAAGGLPITPSPGKPLIWAGVVYSIVNVEAIAPDGTPFLFVVVADA